MFERYKEIPNLIEVKADPPISSQSTYPHSRNILLSKGLYMFAQMGKSVQQEFLLHQTALVLFDIINTENALENLLHPLYLALIYAKKDDYLKESGINAYEIVYTISGEGCLEYEGSTYLLSKGNGFFIDGRKPHNTKTCGEHWEKLVFWFNGPQADNFYQTYSQNGNVLFSNQDCPNIRIYFIEIGKSCQMFIPNYEYKTASYITMFLTELILSQNRRSNSPVVPGTIAIIEAFIKEHLSDELDLDHISRHFGISQSTLSHEFRKHIGFPPKKYITLLRISRAKTYLQTTDWPIEDIANICGFKDTSHFIQLFKKYIGKTPGQFRRSVLKKNEDIF